MPDGSDALASLLGGVGGEDPMMPKVPGAKGAASMEFLRQSFSRQPGLFAQTVRLNLSRARSSGCAEPSTQAASCPRGAFVP